MADQFRYLLVDEYQDTTVAQARLLQGLYRPHRNLTVAGDPYQSIYSFRGAALTNIAEFPAAFPDAAGRPARRLVLTTSFRVPAEILAAAVRVTAGGGLPGEAGPVVPAPGRGSVETYSFDQQTHEAEWIAAEVQRVHLRDRLAYRRMAVLVRTKRRLLTELSRALERRGIPHDEPDRRLADHPAVRVVLDCVRAATTTGPEQAVALRRLLLGAPAALTLSALRDLEREQARTGDPWAEVVRRRLPGGEGLAGLISDPGWAAGRAAVDGFWHLWSTLPHAAEVARSPRRAAERAAWSSLAQVLERLNERDPRRHPGRLPALERGRGLRGHPPARVRLARRRPPDPRHPPPGQGSGVRRRLHRRRRRGRVPRPAAPGVPAGGAPPLPHLARRDRGLRPLPPAGGEAPGLHRHVPGPHPGGVDLHRGAASKKAPASPAGSSPRRPGCAPWAKRRGPPRSRPSLPRPLEAEAWLRRLLADPEQPPPRRLAALGVLVGPASRRARPPEEFAGVLEPGPDTGLIPAGLALSPSQADSYLECPRRYAFERWLQVGAEGSVYAGFGSLVHAVLEEVEGKALEAGEAHGTLDAALAALDRQWDPAPFGGGAWADAWRRRADEVLRHLYEQWPGTGPGGRSGANPVARGGGSQVAGACRPHRGPPRRPAPAPRRRLQDRAQPRVRRAKPRPRCSSASTCWPSPPTRTSPPWGKRPAPRCGSPPPAPRRSPPAPSTRRASAKSASA